ncbi:MAG: lipoate--protein ligase [Synergistaceae bacterium]|nr:lipoate--protein ligase [Synergistaceae bacterium]
MLYIEAESTDAAFHFAVEEYLLLHFQSDEPVMMIWRADKCAMLGCNQIADAEIDLSAAARLGVQVVRRSSGGGTIFIDMGTLLYTFIMSLPYNGLTDVKDIEREYVAGPVARALNRMGIPARIEGRNDILVENRKISGLAQYIRRNRLCTHGSLLYDADLDTLAQVLKPDEEKIRSKSIRSVHSRVANLAQYMDVPLSTEKFRDRIKENLHKSLNFLEYNLTEVDIVQIGRILREKYANPDWTFGKAPRFSFHNYVRFPAGKVEVFLEVRDGIIDSCRIAGDFLGLEPIVELEEHLESKAYKRHDIEEFLGRMELEPYLGGITREQLLSCLFA